MTVSETMVRMGELAVARTPGQVLASIGLGSCIGLALVSRAWNVAGLAHIMLPESPSKAPAERGKYADRAVPALVAELALLGAPAHDLDAVIVGGAQMFALGSGSLDIGARNESAVRAALRRIGIRVLAAATGSNKGRTIRVHADTGLVVVKEVGGVDEPLYEGRSA